MGMADSDPNAMVAVLTKLLVQGFDAIVATVSPSGFDFQAERWKVQFIMNYDQVIRRELEEGAKGAHCFSGKVHRGLGFRKQDFLSFHFSFIELCFKLP